MSRDRKISWDRLLREAKADRADREDVREEVLKGGYTIVPGTLGMSAWRGRSGRRYVGVVYRVDAPDARPDGPAVLVAIRRPDSGPSQIVGADAIEIVSAFPALRTRYVTAGADEIFVYRLADSAEERIGIVLDLKPMPKVVVAAAARAASPPPAPRAKRGAFVKVGRNRLTY